MNIHQRINAVMKDCKYLQKTQAQQGKGVKYDEVIAMLREHLIEHGLTMTFNQESMELIGGVEGTKQKTYQGKYSMTLTNMDEPKEIVVHTVFAHGMDGGDKAPGKAQTYAAKIMLSKGFGLEMGEDEESRSEKMDKMKTITQEQYDQLSRHCLEYGTNGDILGWSDIGLKVASAYKINMLEHLPESKFNTVLTDCMARQAGLS